MNADSLGQWVVIATAIDTFSQLRYLVYSMPRKGSWLCWCWCCSSRRRIKDKTQEGIPLDELQESTPLINGSGYFRQYGSAPNSVLMVKTPSKKVKTVVNKKEASVLYVSLLFCCFYTFRQVKILVAGDYGVGKSEYCL